MARTGSVFARSAGAPRIGVFAQHIGIFVAIFARDTAANDLAGGGASRPLTGAGDSTEGRSQIGTGRITGALDSAERERRWVREKERVTCAGASVD